MKRVSITGHAIRHLQVASLLALLVFALAPGLLAAAETRGGSEVIVGPGQTVNDDLYLGGGNISILGTVNGDVVVTGGTVMIAGSIHGDLLAAAGETTVQGPIGRNVRVIGGTVQIDSAVAQDVAVAGGTVTLGPTAQIGRDLLVGAGTAVIGGTVMRNAKLAARNVTLDGTIKGNVRFEGATLRLAPQASIGGNLTYAADNEVVIPGGSATGVVGGQVQRLPRTAPIASTPVQDAIGGIIGWARAVVGLVALGLILVLVFPSFSRRTVATLGESWLASFGLGLAAFLVIPIGAVLLFGLGLIIGGWWLGLMAMALYGIALAAGLAVTALSIGIWLWDRAAGPGIHPVWALVLGMVALVTAGLIPILGGIITLLALLIGLGALIFSGYRLYTEPHARGLTDEVTPARPRVGIA